MDAMSIAVASGMRSRMEALDLLANNIANANSAGFKADREFYNLYTAPDALAGGGEDSATLPVVERHWTDFSAGATTATGNPLDVAIQGSAFFAVQGPGSKTLYTRNGNFRVSPEGELQTQNGYNVLDTNGKKVRLDPTADVVISADGSVTQRGQQLGQLQLAEITDNSLLEKAGSTYFSIVDRAGLVRQATQSKLQQGRLEMANGAPAEHAVRLVSIMRQFETLQKALGIGSEMNRKAIEEVARVTG